MNARFPRSVGTPLAPLADSTFGGQARIVAPAVAQAA
jgi:hypothetical protein